MLNFCHFQLKEKEKHINWEVEHISLDRASEGIPNGGSKHAGSPTGDPSWRIPETRGIGEGAAPTGIAGGARVGSTPPHPKNQNRCQSATEILFCEFSKYRGILAPVL